jgi:hypothetical protein
MAYGVKYRLEFSDDLENGKKIEILKKNYTSSTVLDIVGGAEPCVISWQGDDDFYLPIKGSQCTLNFFVTDDTNYDNFYEYDEREYQVKISYKDSSNNYQLFWIGWLVTDQFKEAITTKPFPITLKAIDGLGTLDSFDMTLYQDSYSAITARQWITSTLANLDLDLDIYVSQDIVLRNAGSTIYSIYDAMSINPFALQKDFLGINNAKHTLEQILKITNARIFQSFGRWYIINNSSYSAQSIKDASSATAAGGSVPTGIRAAESASLVSNGTESIKYIIYNYQGTYQSATTTDILKQIPSDLKPIENNLTKEYLRPLKEFIINHETSQYLETNNFQNSGFENGLTFWSTYTSTGTTSPGVISTEFSKQGNQSFKNSQTQTNQTGTRKTLSNTNGVSVYNSAHQGHTLKVNTYFDVNSNYGAVSFRWQLRVGPDPSSPPPQDPTYYWNNASEAWQTTAVVNLQTIDEDADKWQEFKYDLGSFPITGLLFIDLYEPYVQTSGGLNALYYDNITLEFDRKEGDKRTPFYSDIDDFAYKRTRAAASNISGVLELGDLQLSQNNYANVLTSTAQIIRPRDNNANFAKTLEKIITQQVINDYRTQLIRYEGKLYNTENDPFGLNNKIWVNFGSSILREPVSCIIDQMTYNVKRNSYEVVMHIPNQDDDQTSTFKATF